MSLHARVLILARDDSLAGPLAEGLDRLGWRTVTARGAQAAAAALGDLQIEAAIVDIRSFGETADDLVRQVRAANGARRLPMIAIGHPQGAPVAAPQGVEASAYDLTLAAPLHPAQAAARLETLVRTATAQEELALRTATFAERGAALDPGQPGSEPWRILAVGEPAPRFLALSNALTQHGGEVVG